MRTAFLLAALAACSFKAGGAASDSGGPDGSHVDAPADGSGSGSGSAATARQGFDIVSGGGRLHAGAITIDVEIGTAVPVSRLTAGPISVAGAPTVVP